MTSFPFQIAVIPFLLALALTPVVRRLATKLEIVDAPDGHRKLHAGAIPLGGGVVVFSAAALTLGLTILVGLPGSDVLSRHPRFLWGLAGASAFICAAGLLDDRFDLRGRQKLAAQVVAVLVLAVAGLVIEEVELFGWHIRLGLLAVPFTMFWLLGAINALNLIDGVDGLATSVGVILSVTIAAMAWMGNHFADAICAVVLAGSLAGFLIYNLPPAKIYLGDSGSMLVGLVLGVLAIRSSLKGPATVALAAPTAIWTILIFDVGMAILRRKLTGRSLYTTDRSHLHHALQKRGYSIRRTVFVIGLLCMACGAGALASVALKSEWTAVLSAAAVVATLVVTRFFGHSECRLLLQRMRNLAVSLVHLPNRQGLIRKPLCSRFDGHREWEQLWQSLVEFAERFDLCSVQLNVNSPAIGEEYHAVWERREHPPLQRLWRSEVPLFLGSLAVGRLTVAGTVPAGTVVAWMAELIEGLNPFEMQLTELLENDVDVRSRLAAVDATSPLDCTGRREPVVGPVIAAKQEFLVNEGT